MPGIFMAGYRKLNSDTHIFAYLETALTPHSAQFTEDTAELKYCNKIQMQSALSIGRIGANWHLNQIL